jgi:MFS family permease
MASSPSAAPPHLNTTGGLRGPLRILINRHYALLWAGETISVIGDFTFATTLVLWVAVLIAHGQPWAPLAVSGVLIATIAPEFVVAPVAGVFTDRWNKRRIMLAMDVARAVLVALLIAATGIVPLPFVPDGHLPPAWQLVAIYAVVFLASACGQFFNPSMLALIANLVEEPERARASGLRQGAASLGTIVGPALAAALFFGVGITWALLLNAVSFLVSFLAVRAIPATAAVPPPGGETPADQEASAARASVFRELGAGLRFYFGNRVLVTLLVAGMLTLVGFGTLNTLDLFFVTQNLHAAPGLYGILTSVQGAGLLVGAIFAAAFAQRLGVGRVLGGALVAWGLLILVYARLTSIGPALVVMALTGFLLSTAQVAETPLFLHVTPHEFLGRAFSIFAPAISAGELIGIALSGYLDSTVLQHFHARVLGVALGPVDTIFTIVGLAILLAGLYALSNLGGIVLAQRSPPAAPPDG